MYATDVFVLVVVGCRIHSLKDACIYIYIYIFFLILGPMKRIL